MLMQVIPVDSYAYRFSQFKQWWMCIPTQWAKSPKNSLECVFC